jgi:hypothetical protein
LDNRRQASWPSQCPPCWHPLEHTFEWPPTYRAPKVGSQWSQEYPLRRKKKSNYIQ